MFRIDVGLRRHPTIQSGCHFLMSLIEVVFNKLLNANIFWKKLTITKPKLGAMMPRLVLVRVLRA